MGPHTNVYERVRSGEAGAQFRKMSRGGDMSWVNRSVDSRASDQVPRLMRGLPSRGWESVVAETRSVIYRNGGSRYDLKVLVSPETFEQWCKMWGVSTMTTDGAASIVTQSLERVAALASHERGPELSGLAVVHFAPVPSGGYPFEEIELDGRMHRVPDLPFALQESQWPLGGQLVKAVVLDDLTGGRRAAELVGKVRALVASLWAEGLTVDAENLDFAIGVSRRRGPRGTGRSVLVRDASTVFSVDRTQLMESLTRWRDGGLQRATWYRFLVERGILPHPMTKAAHHLCRELEGVSDQALGILQERNSKPSDLAERLGLGTGPSATRSVL